MWHIHVPTGPVQCRLLDINKVSEKDCFTPRLTLYFREGCHLCEDLEQQLEDMFEPGSFKLIRVDIDTDEALKAAYNVRVPVLCCENTEVCEHFLDLESLQIALSDAHASYNTPAVDN